MPDYEDVKKRHHGVRIEIPFIGSILGHGRLMLWPSAARGGSIQKPERGFMVELLGFISYLITLYTYIVIAGVVMS